MAIEPEPEPEPVLAPGVMVPPTVWSPLSRSFYARPTTTVARELLGKLLVRTRDAQRLVARIVEVEAYLGLRDQASHARRGPTPRAAIMFGPPGHLYVYLIYGMHHCMNIVTEGDGTAGAVLIRAAEPISGLPISVGAGAARSSLPLTGPGKVCRALQIARADNGLDLTRPGAFLVADDGGRVSRPATSARIGVAYAGAWARRKLRFYVRGNRYVSGHPR